MTGKAVRFVLISVLMSVVLAASAWAEPVRIGIVRDGPWARYGDVVELLKQEVIQVTQSEFEVVFPEQYNIDGGWTLTEINRALEQLLADPDVDMVIALGYVASHEAVRRTDRSKPVIAPLVMDAVAQNFPTEGGSCGEENLCYVNSLRTIRRDADAFGNMVDFGHLAILSNELSLLAIPELKEAAQIAARSAKIDVEVHGVTSTAQPALDALSPEVDAVMITPLMQMGPVEFT